MPSDRHVAAAAGRDGGGRKRAGSVKAASTAASSDWFQESLYESQRGFYFAGRFKFSSNALLLIDPPKWTTLEGKSPPARPKYLQVPSEDAWEWATEWLVDMSARCDRDGWQYAFTFFSRWHPTCGGLHRFVRRRRWIRFRRRKNVEISRSAEEAIMVASATGSLASADQSAGLTGAALGPSFETLLDASVSTPIKGKAVMRRNGSPLQMTSSKTAEPALPDIWRRLTEECRIDRERLEVLYELSEASPEEVLMRLDDCLLILDYDRSRASFLRRLLGTSRTLQRKFFEEGTRKWTEVEKHLTFFSYWTELGIST